MRHTIHTVFNWCSKVIGRPNPYSVAQLRVIMLDYPEKRRVTHSSISVSHIAFEPHNGFVLLIGAVEQFSNSIKRNCRIASARSEEHTSELQSRQYLVCRLLLEKKTYTTLAQRTLGSIV